MLPKRSSEILMFPFNRLAHIYSSARWRSEPQKMLVFVLFKCNYGLDDIYVANKNAVVENPCILWVFHLKGRFLDHRTKWRHSSVGCWIINCLLFWMGVFLGWKRENVAFRWKTALLNIVPFSPPFTQFPFGGIPINKRSHGENSIKF